MTETIIRLQIISHHRWHNLFVHNICLINETYVKSIGYKINLYQATKKITTCLFPDDILNNTKRWQPSQFVNADATPT